MNLKEILQNIIDSKETVALADSEKEWEAGDLLASLSDRMLNRKAHMQAGMYIAEVDEGGYLGRVMYRIKRK
ncbi:MAG: hypothetical protein H6695_17470 [Deferribacteres bacterium]|nr:hypothetical protein [candidate division KSB1 bacterium]MCB9511971.1 hypothetical protein [Deferribacteres bacterium]